MEKYDSPLDVLSLKSGLDGVLTSVGLGHNS